MRRRPIKIPQPRVSDAGGRVPTKIRLGIATWRKARSMAEKRGVSLSRFIAELVEEVSRDKTS